MIIVGLGLDGSREDTSGQVARDHVVRRELFVERRARVTFQLALDTLARSQWVHEGVLGPKHGSLAKEVEQRLS